MSEEMTLFPHTARVRLRTLNRLDKFPTCRVGWKPMNETPTQPQPQKFDFRVDAALVARFREVATANHRTMSQELRQLMERHVNEHEGRHA